MKPYNPSRRPRIALALIAVTLAVATLGAFVVLPATIESGAADAHSVVAAGLALRAL